MSVKLKSYFYVSLSQRKAIVIATVVIAAYSLLKLALTYYYSPPLPEIQFVTTQNEYTPTEDASKTKLSLNSVTPTQLSTLGIRPKIAATLVKYRTACNGFHSIKQVEKIYGINPKELQIIREKLPLTSGEKILPSVAMVGKVGKLAKSEAEANLRLRSFNPNTIKSEDLADMGIPKQIVNGIINFRKSGFIYRSKGDVKKVYAIDSQWYDKISNYIDLPPVAHTTLSKSTPEKHKTIQTLDINSASQEELQALPGIGAYYAGKIVKYRNGLGGYIQTDQLKSLRVIPDTLYEKVQQFLEVKQMAERIRINTVTLSELKHLWYIGPQAYLIINYRTARGSIGSFDEMTTIAGIDKEKLVKVRPYLDFTK
jgi:DNA uptake protein ComE-like DNA-binding protein